MFALQFDLFDFGHEPAAVVGQEVGHIAEDGITETLTGQTMFVEHQVAYLPVHLVEG